MEGCLSMAKTTGRIREHFMFRHWKYKVFILQEGPEPIPWCDKCRIHMQAARLFKYWQSDKCHKLTERRLRRRDVKMVLRCEEMEFNLDGE